MHRSYETTASLSTASSVDGRVRNGISCIDSGISSNGGGGVGDHIGEGIGGRRVSGSKERRVSV